ARRRNCRAIPEPGRLPVVQSCWRCLRGELRTEIAVPLRRGAAVLVLQSQAVSPSAIAATLNHHSDPSRFDLNPAVTGLRCFAKLLALLPRTPRLDGAGTLYFPGASALLAGH